MPLPGPRRSSARRLGACAEQAAARWYARRGCEVVGTNLRLGGAEADVVVRVPGSNLLVIAEVKALAGAKMHPAERVDGRKRRHLERFAALLLAQPAHRGAGVRFDVIAVRPRRWITMAPWLARVPVLRDLGWRIEHLPGAWSAERG